MNEVKRLKQYFSSSRKLRSSEAPDDLRTQESLDEDEYGFTVPLFLGTHKIKVHMIGVTVGANHEEAQVPEVLCLTEKNGKKLQLRQLRLTNKKELVQAKKWKLETLVEMDYLATTKNAILLLFENEKPLRFRAFEEDQRNQFLWQLYEICKNHFLASRLPRTGSIDMSAIGFEGAGVNLESEELLSKLVSPDSNDLSNLQTLFEDCDKESLEINQLAEKLQEKLNKLEEDNINEIISSETAMRLIQSRLNETGKKVQTLQQWLLELEKASVNMRHYVQHFEAKNNRLEIVGENQKKLLDELAFLCNHLEVPGDVVKVIEKGGFNLGPELTAVQDAANNLEEIYKFYLQLTPEMKQTKLVEERMKDIQTLLDQLSSMVLTKLQENFSRLASEEKNRKTKDVVWSPLGHYQIYETLSHYEILAQWLFRIYAYQQKLAKRDTLVDAYKHFIKEVYKKETKELFSYFDKYIIKDHTNRHLLQLTKVAASFTAKEIPQRLIERLQGDSICGFALKTIIPVFLQEQQFCQKFFRFEQNTDPKLEKLLMEIFQETLQEFCSMLETIDKSDHIAALSCLNWIENALNQFLGETKVSMASNKIYSVEMTSQPWIRDSLTPSVTESPYVKRFLEDLIGVVIKQWTVFIEGEVQTLREEKISIKRAGILGMVLKFPQFIQLVENASKNKIAKGLGENGLKKVFETIAFNLEHTKKDKKSEGESSEHLYIMRLENYHFLFTNLTSLNFEIVAVEQLEDEFQKNKRMYLDFLFHKYFDTLCEFFAHLEKLLQTIPPPEIQYQQSFNKQSASKALSSFPAQKVEKKVVSLLKSVAKNVSVESLKKEVSISIKDYAQEQWGNWERHLSECYQGSQISLSVTSENLKLLFAQNTKL